MEFAGPKTTFDPQISLFFGCRNGGRSGPFLLNPEKMAYFCQNLDGFIRFLVTWCVFRGNSDRSEAKMVENKVAEI